MKTSSHLYKASKNAVQSLASNPNQSFKVPVSPELNTDPFLYPCFVALGCAVVDVLDVRVVWVAQAVAVKDVSVCAQQIRLLS